MGKFRLAVAAICVALVGAAALATTARAYNCTTTCSGSGNFRTCNTSCF